MKQKWKDWLEQRGLQKWFQRDNLLILILAGILLFVVTFPVGEEEDEVLPDSGGIWKNESGTGAGKSSKEDSGKEGSGKQGLLGGNPVGADMTEDYYIGQLEEKLENILSGMDGVGKVNVMVTLASSSEYVVEKDEIYNRSQTNEADSEGGTRIITQIEEQSSTVYNSVGNDTTPYVVKTLLPTVEGVVVVAEGAGTGKVNTNITEVVQALFDVEIHKIKVVKMSKTN